MSIKPKTPDIARFGAAILRDAQEEYADESTALYKVHAPLKDVVAFYRAVYGQQQGFVLQVDTEAQPPQLLVAVGDQVQESDFSTLMVQPHPCGQVHRQQIVIIARGPADEGDQYPKDNPWLQRK
ncbi:MAG TPA: hypothetical protein DCQ06_03945 [Myxococcales bacterium]|nr:hypothetical protein [Myxococcales bacterium]HAN30726.1 hypothetical protein [Myxococcales bacterium]